MSVVRDEVGQQPVALLDNVVVVRNRLAGLDRTVLSSGDVRRLAGEEPGGVEPHLEVVALACQRLDVTELDPLGRRPEPGLRRDSGRLCSRDRSRDRGRLGHRPRAPAPCREDRDDESDGQAEHTALHALECRPRIANGVRPTAGGARTFPS